MTREGSPEFQKAAQESKQLTSKPGNDDLLALYALYKVATQEDIAAAPAPGMFDMKEKAKRKAWQKEIDAGTTPEQAEEKYIKLVEGLKASHGFDASKSPEAVKS